jgi:hypothetical protein
LCAQYIKRFRARIRDVVSYHPRSFEARCAQLHVGDLKLAGRESALNGAQTDSGRVPLRESYIGLNFACGGWRLSRLRGMHLLLWRAVFGQ